MQIVKKCQLSIFLLRKKKYNTMYTCKFKIDFQTDVQMSLPFVPITDMTIITQHENRVVTIYIESVTYYAASNEFYLDGDVSY